MILTFEKTQPILKIKSKTLLGWKTDNMPENYPNKKALVFSNCVEDKFIEQNLFELLKGYSLSDFPNRNIEFLIEPYSANVTSKILKKVPYPFTGLKIALSGSNFSITFDLIQDFVFEEGWDKKWTNEFYFDSFAKLIKSNKEIKITYRKDDFLSLDISFIVSAESIEQAVNIAIEKLKDTIVKVECSINGLGEFFDAIEVWKEQRIEKKEVFWHRLLKKYSWLLSLIINEPAIILENEAYVGGKSLKNDGGNVIDFIYQNKLSKNVALIEIKTPHTTILGKKYRNTYTLSPEFTGAVNQLLNYRDNFQKNYYTLKHNSDLQFTLIAPNAYLIIGSHELMNKGEKDCFELYRKNLSNITIITFDELFEKAFFVLTMMQK